jgi:hypothetical protein
MGRCGRAGKRDGRGVIFYGGGESELVEVVKQAELEQEKMVLQGNEIEEQDQEGDEKNQELGQTSVVAGKVKNAFSRRRGFTKKRKKLVKKSTRDDDDEYIYNDN